MPPQGGDESFVSTVLPRMSELQDSVNVLYDSNAGSSPRGLVPPGDHTKLICTAALWGLIHWLHPALSSSALVTSINKHLFIDVTDCSLLVYWRR